MLNNMLTGARSIFVPRDSYRRHFHFKVAIVFDVMVCALVISEVESAALAKGR